MFHKTRTPAGQTQIASCRKAPRTPIDRPIACGDHAVSAERVVHGRLTCRDDAGGAQTFSPRTSPAYGAPTMISLDDIAGIPLRGPVSVRAESSPGTRS